MFTQNTFTPVSSHGNSDSPNSWSYRSNDTKAQISAEDYFVKKYPILNDGDFIFIAASDGALQGSFVESLGKFTVLDLAGGVNSAVLTTMRSVRVFTRTTMKSSPLRRLQLIYE